MHFYIVPKFALVFQNNYNLKEIAVRLSLYYIYEKKIQKVKFFYSKVNSIETLRSPLSAQRNKKQKKNITTITQEYNLLYVIIKRILCP